MQPKQLAGTANVPVFSTNAHNCNIDARRRHAQPHDPAHVSPGVRLDVPVLPCLACISSQPSCSHWVSFCTMPKEFGRNGEGFCAALSVHEDELISKLKEADLSENQLVELSASSASHLLFPRRRYPICPWRWQTSLFYFPPK